MDNLKAHRHSYSNITVYLHSMRSVSFDYNNFVTFMFLHFSASQNSVQWRGENQIWLILTIWSFSSFVDLEWISSRPTYSFDLSVFVMRTPYGS